MSSWLLVTNFGSGATLCKRYLTFTFVLFLVKLMGGSGDFEGNVFATNPTTGKYGPVCDDKWSIENVSFTFSH